MKLCSVAELYNKWNLALTNGGDGRIRTAEWEFCRLLPCHLATSPRFFIVNEDIFDCKQSG